MKTKFISCLLLFNIALTNAQNYFRTFNLDDAPRYSEETGYGYDFLPTPSKGSKAPFYFSVKVPEGNYKVTVRIGNKKRAGLTTVKAESRRLFIKDQPTKKNEFIEKSFIVNIRTPRISEHESVKIKGNEKKKLNWDEKLTLEFNGEAPVCESISVAPTDSSITTIFLCGNSTVVDQDNEPWASWGQMLPYFFNTNVCIANHAQSGESAESFITTGRFNKVLAQMKTGDYVFIEFGHNDKKLKGPGKGAYYSFMTCLKTYIDEVQAKGGYPVLVTPTQRRNFDNNGYIIDSHGEYLDAIRWLAIKENILIIDLSQMTSTLYEALGEEESKHAFVHYPAKSYPEQNHSLADNTHFNPYGAFQIAQCIVEGIKAKIPELAKQLQINSAYNPAHPDNTNTFHWNNSPFIKMK